MTKCLTCGMDGRECFCGSSPMTADTSKSLDLQAHPEVGASPAASAELTKALKTLDLFWDDWTEKKDIHEAMHVLAAHVAALTAQLEAERERADDWRGKYDHLGRSREAEVSALYQTISRETARADAAEKERDDWHHYGVVASSVLLNACGLFGVKTDAVELIPGWMLADPAKCGPAFVAARDETEERFNVHDRALTAAYAARDAAVAEAKALRERLTWVRGVALNENGGDYWCNGWVMHSTLAHIVAEIDATLAQPADGGK